MFDSEVEIAVLDCTLDWPNYTERFGDIFDNSNIFKVMNKEFPDDPDAVVITGSTYTVPWDDEWINMLVEKTSLYIEEGVPVLGLCFGHQVIAEAVGGEVVDMDDYEIGYKAVEMSDCEIFDGLGSIEYPFSTHKNKIADLPSDIEIIAETERSIQAIRKEDKPVFGVQFHPELTPRIAEKAINGKDIEEERKDRLLSQVNPANFYRAKRALKIIENFVDFAEESEKRRIEA